ncbi:MAG TPA: preprotein translocase subunit YajC [Nannocystaceae bacterium]|nr:preprotein translocase subunit YajC [Nannocystaceae bacterium]
MLHSTLLFAQGGGSAFTGVLPIILMFAIVYFIVLRPMSRQEKDRKKRVETLKKGDQVVIGGGILGRVSNLDDPKVAVVEIADKVKIRVLRKDIVDSADAALAAVEPPKGKAAAAKDKEAEKADEAKP